MINSLDLQGLNSSQKEAVETVHGPLLVLAGAGTGKTRVITYRIAHLISKGYAAEKILSVTFTNKAAKEMLERSNLLIGNKRGQKKPVISTFHSLCVKILRQEIELLGYPKTFSIIDRGDQESIAREILRTVRIPEGTMKTGDFISKISQWKSAGFTPEQALNDTDDDRDYLVGTAYRKYASTLRSTGRVDFDDLLLLTNRLFEEHPDALTRQQQRFDFVQIDEYQDTNGLQFKLISNLVAPHKNLCVVGDDDQSIYGWRGADVKHILSFGQHFEGTKTIRLEDNYRCTDQILELANRLVQYNRHRHHKTLRAHKVSEEAIRILDFPDAENEAEKVVFEIYYYLKTSGSRGQ